MGIAGLYRVGALSVQLRQWGRHALSRLPRIVVTGGFRGGYVGALREVWEVKMDDVSRASALPSLPHGVFYITAAVATAKAR